MNILKMTMKKIKDSLPERGGINENIYEYYYC